MHLRLTVFSNLANHCSYKVENVSCTYVFLISIENIESSTDKSLQCVSVFWSLAEQVENYKRSLKALFVFQESRGVARRGMLISEIAVIENV